LAIIAIASVVAIAVIAFVLSVGPGSIPEPEPVSPFAHLDERKTAIYENLRDLQNTKRDLQKELAAVLAEVDRIKAGLKPAVQVPAPAPPLNGPSPKKAPPKRASGFECEACGAAFEKPLKFCGECGKPMKVGTV